MQNLPAFSLFVPRQWRALLLMAMFSFALHAAWAQNPVLDSLRNEQKRDPANDTLRMKVYIQYALQYYAQSEVDSAASFIEKAHQLATQLHHAGGLADYHHFMAVSSKQRQQLDTAMHHAREELRWALEAADENKLAYAYNDVGNMHIYFGNGDSATINLLRGLPVAEKANNHRLAANISFNLSAAYNMIANYTASRDYAKKSHQIASRINVSTYMFHSLYNWATQESKLGHVDSALTMFDQCVSLAKKLDNDAFLADVYNNIGEILYNQKRFRASLQEYEKMAEIASRLGDPQVDLYLYMNRGNTLAALRRYQQADNDLAEAQRIGEELKANFELGQVFLFRSELSEKTRDFQKALHFLKKADTLKSTIANEQSLKEIQRLEVQYQTAAKDKTLAEQKAVLAMRQAALRKKDMVNTVLIMGCLLLTGLILLVYKHVRNRQKLHAKEQELNRQKINELEKERQLVAAQSLMKGQEEERSRLAKDLHDGVGGLLSGVKLGLSTMKGNVFLSEENAQAVNTILGQLDNSIAELRRVSHNMMPEALVKFGLKEALENYCENIIQSSPLDVRLQTYGLDQRLEQDTEIILYRMVQELLNNVIKHAEATQALVQLIRESDKFTLTVEDDGKGFDANDPNHHQGAGLQNIKARAGYVNGVVDIRTRPGEGTSITIEGNLH